MAIAFVNGATNGSASAVTTIGVTYSPTPGNVVIVAIATGGVVQNGAVVDNNNNPLAAGPALLNTDVVATYWYVAAAGATSFTASWTTARTANIAVVEYSGVLQVNEGLAGNTASGTSTAPSITVNTEDSNDFVVAAFVTVSQTMTVTVGNLRKQIATATAPRLTVADNTVAAAGSVSVTGTITSAAWAAVLIELRTVAAAVGPSNWLGKQVATGINKH